MTHQHNQSKDSIYIDKDININSNTFYRVPGFFNINFIQTRNKVSELSVTEICKLAYFQQLLRLYLKSEFNIDVCGLYVEGSINTPIVSYTIPFHKKRLKNKFNLDEYQPYTREYLESYNTSSIVTIAKYNSRFRDLLNSAMVKSDIQQLEHGILTKEFISADLTLPNTDTTAKIEKIIEVYEENELPKPNINKKYYVCIGGSKNYQGFLRKKDLSKGEFLLKYESIIDKCLKPIYQDDQIIIRQDSRYAIPGFYIISPKNHYRSIYEIPLSIYAKCLWYSKLIQKGLEMFGISNTFIFHDEKFNNRMSAHFWSIPLHTKFIEKHKLNPTILSRDIWEYLDKYPKYSITKQEILNYNKKMKSYLSLNASTGNSIFDQ